MRYFASALPGIGLILREEIRDTDEATPGHAEWFDGRNDVVPFEAVGTFDVDCLRTSEDVYAEVSRSGGAGDVREVAHALANRDRLDRALSVLSQRTPLRANASVRIIVRLRHEESFQRRELRDHLTKTVLRLRPRWRMADPAQLELWALEVESQQFVLGLRLTTSSMRHRGGRVIELPGALRPTVAAAMVRAAGRATDAPLVDVCCGSGTILREATDVGWNALGNDTDSAAVAAARHNAPDATVAVADARQVPLDDGQAGAVVTNLPFGKQHRAAPQLVRWRREVINEMVRVTHCGAAIVILVESRSNTGALLEGTRAATVTSVHSVRIKGLAASMWVGRRK